MFSLKFDNLKQNFFKKSAWIFYSLAKNADNFGRS